MEPALKQRLLGAAVLVALAVVFLPLLVMDPAPDSGASRVPLRVPAAPDTGGETRTLDLPLATPGAPVLPTPAAASATPATDAAVATPATAAGDYAVNFGSYATTADAARVIAALAAATLPAYQEASTLGTRTVHRVRIGPYATAAAAEAARLAAARVRSDVNARVVVLDAAAATAPAAMTAPAATAPPIATAPLPAASATQVSTASRGAPSGTTPTTSTSTVTAGTDRTGAASVPPQPAAPPAPPAPRAPAAPSVGFAVQLGAFANPEEAARLRDRARGAGFAAFVEQVRTDHGTLNRVRVGPAPDRAAADVLRSQLAAKLGVSGIVRPHP